jgi:hypothetical protein
MVRLNSVMLCSDFLYCCLHWSQVLTQLLAFWLRLFWGKKKLIYIIQKLKEDRLLFHFKKSSWLPWNTCRPSLVKINLVCPNVIKGDALTFGEDLEVSFRRPTIQYRATRNIFCIITSYVSWDLEKLLYKCTDLYCIVCTDSSNESQVPVVNSSNWFHN